MGSRVTTYLIFSFIYIGYFIVRKLRIMRSSSAYTLNLILPDSKEAKEFFIDSVEMIIESPVFAEQKLTFLKEELEGKTADHINEESGDTDTILRMGLIGFLLDNIDVLRYEYGYYDEVQLAVMYDDFIDSQRKLLRKQNTYEGFKWFLEQLVCELPPIILFILGFRNLSMVVFLLFGWLYGERYHKLGGSSTSTPIINYLTTQVPYLVGIIFL